MARIKVGFGVLGTIDFPLLFWISPHYRGQPQAAHYHCTSRKDRRANLREKTVIKTEREKGTATFSDYCSGLMFQQSCAWHKAGQRWLRACSSGQFMLVWHSEGLQTGLWRALNYAHSCLWLPQGLLQQPRIHKAQ